jgi:uncharacterized membrane protein YdbT with pleckstrin-like domain
MMNAVIDRFRLSVVGWLLGTLAGWGTVLLTIGGFIAMLALSIAGGLDVPLWAPLVLTVIGFAIIGWKMMESLSTHYELTEDRLILRRGIFVKSIDEIELYRVKDVRLDYSLVNQLAGIGTIGITSSDGTTAGNQLSLVHVARAQARREMLRNLVETARQKRRVREIDLLHEDL